MSYLSVFIQMEVRSKQSVRGCGHHFYTAEQTRSAMAEIATNARIAMGMAVPICGAIELTIDAVFLPPESWSKTKKSRALLGRIMHTVKPDADNIAKLTQDSLNKVWWRDDAMVVRLIVEKRYGSPPGLHITARRLENEDG